MSEANATLSIPQTSSFNLVHIMFSTKNRIPHIGDQKTHHRKRSFQDEKYHVAFDERYVWD